MSQLQSQAAAPSQEVLDLFKFDFDPKALKAKYLEERDKVGDFDSDFEEDVQERRLTIYARLLSA